MTQIYHYFTVKEADNQIIALASLSLCNEERMKIIWFIQGSLSFSCAIQSQKYST